MLSCDGCKYNTKYINVFKNWCYEPTFPKGRIVFTKGGCDNWKRATVVVVLPNFTKKANVFKNDINNVNSREYGSVSKNIQRRRKNTKRFVMNKKKTKEFIREWFMSG